MNVVYYGKSGDAEAIERIKKCNLPVIIGGIGSVADAVEKKLLENGISTFKRCPVKLIDGEIQIEGEVPYEKYIYAYGFLDSYRYPLRLFNTLKGCDGVAIFSELYETESFTYDYYINHEEVFKKTYEIMKDDFSKLSMEAYITARINESAEGLYQLVTRPQYFGVDFFENIKDEFLVDCGAFNGDTLRDFVSWTENTYKGYIALEPNKKNANALRKYINETGIKNVDVIEKCAYERTEELSFRINAENSRIAKTGAEVETVLADTIDNISSGQKVTFIKMDIEGAELSALKGAEYTIKSDRPILAISAYHKPSDLIELTSYIKDCVEEYNFYFRLHKELPIDAILYAVPAERNL